MKHVICYNIVNGGDGSAYPRFFSSEKLAVWDEEHKEEEWGESSVGTLVINTEGPIVVEDIVTPESYLVGLWENEEDTDEFIQEFFSGGIPPFTAVVQSTHGNYHYIAIHTYDKFVCRIWCSTSQTPEAVANALNSL